MSAWLELHDSTLRSISVSNGSVRIVLDAYIHRWQFDRDAWRGTGSMQTVHVTIRSSRRVLIPRLPAEITGGRLCIGAQIHENGVTVPMDAADRTSLRLDLIGQDAFAIEGHGIQVESIGEPTYVEDLPPDMRPPHL